MFERHVGLENKKYSLNAYSSSPNQITKWIKSFKEVKSIIGEGNKIILDEEKQALDKLKRGVYAKKDIRNECGSNQENRRHWRHLHSVCRDGTILYGCLSSHVLTVQ